MPSLSRVCMLVMSLVLVVLAACAPPREWPSELVALEDEMLTLVNEARTSGALCPVSVMAPVDPVVDNEELRWSARLHAEDMGLNAYFAHDSLDGRDPWERMAAAGYTGDPRAENIAAGNDTAEATFAQWMSSEGHCTNIMLAGANELGTGVAFVEGSPYGWYWVQNFGER